MPTISPVKVVHIILYSLVLSLLCHPAASQLRDTVRKPITLNLQMATEYEDTRSCSFIIGGVGALFTGYGAYSRQRVPVMFGSVLIGSGTFIYTYNFKRFRKYLPKKKRNE